MNRMNGGTFWEIQKVGTSDGFGTFKKLLEWRIKERENERSKKCKNRCLSLFQPSSSTSFFPCFLPLPFHSFLLVLWFYRPSEQKQPQREVYNCFEVPSKILRKRRFQAVQLAESPNRETKRERERKSKERKEEQEQRNDKLARDWFKTEQTKKEGLTCSALIFLESLITSKSPKIRNSLGSSISIISYVELTQC